VDETPIGVFLELESQSENECKQWIDSTAERLGFGAQDYITASYAALYMEYRESNPGAPPDMVFAEYK
jgi:hypothetical protein